MTSTCSTPKGAGKNGYKGKGDNKGKGKGDWKGKGKGGYAGGAYKGNTKGDGKGKGKGKAINGSCYNCGAFGHMSKDCHSQGKGVNTMEQSQQYFEPYCTDAINSSEEYMMTLALDVNDYGSVKPKTGWKTIDKKVHQKYYEMFKGFMSIEEANTYDQSRSRQDKIKHGNMKTNTYNMFESLQEDSLDSAEVCVASAFTGYLTGTSPGHACEDSTTHRPADPTLEMNSTVTTNNEMAETLEKNSTVTTTNDMTGGLFDFDSLDEAEKSTDIMTLDIMNVETKAKKKMKAIGKGRITIDSGAAESVIPLDMLKQVRTIPGDASKQNTIYTSADGGQMWNHGHSYVHFRSTGEQDICMADFQRTTVKKPLASVSRIVEKGNKVVFDENGGFIENLKTGKKIKIVRNNGTFAIEVEYLVEDDEPPKADFTRQW